jgi:hypothetical protein
MSDRCVKILDDMALRATRWGEAYMAGEKRRAFIPTPDELRRKYGDNALIAASTFGAMRPLVYLVFAIMGICGVLIVVLGEGNGPGFTGWAVALLVIDVFGAASLVGAIAVGKGRRIASLREGRPH